MGNVQGNVMERLDNGFTKSTSAHRFGPELNAKEEIQKLEPYVARFVPFRYQTNLTSSHQKQKL